MISPYARVVPSLLERCRDQAPARPTSFAASRQAALDAIRQDVQTLLNTRRMSDLLSSADPAGRYTLHRYGIPDNVLVTEDEQLLCRAIVEAITLFEPRLTRVSVLATIRSPDGLTLQVQLGAMLRLRLEPSPGAGGLEEPVRFETTVFLCTRHLKVQKVQGALSW